MRLGLALDLGSTSPAADQLSSAVPLLAVAERCGLESVWLGESWHQSPEAFHLPAALLGLSHLAPQTSLGLGTGVLLLRAYDPLRLAHEAALLDQLCRGRLTLGIGLGHKGLASRFNQRTADVESVVETLRGAWSQDGNVAPSPHQPGGPRLLLGGAVAASARRAARIGDGYYAAANYADDLVGEQAATYRREGGRGEVIANRICLVEESGEEARRLAVKHLAPIFSYYTEKGLWRSSSPDHPPQPPALVGDTGEVAAQVRHLERAGVTQLNLRVWTHGMPIAVARRTLELITEALRSSTQHEVPVPDPHVGRK